MSLSGYASPKDVQGTQRPNRHYLLCACGKWMKKESLQCRRCREINRTSAQYDTCTCGRSKKVSSGQCIGCLRGGLCGKGVHPMGPENRRPNGGCLTCYTARRKREKPKGVRQSAPGLPPVDFLVGYVMTDEPLAHWKWYGCTGTG